MKSEKIQVELTADELAYLEEKRAKDEEIRLLARTEQEKKIEEAIASVSKKIVRILEKNEKQVQAATKFFQGFDSSEWELVIDSKTVTLDKSEGNYITDENGNEKYKTTVLYAEDYTYNKAYIYHKASNKRFKVEINEHFVYTDRYFFHPVNKGYKMFLSGKGIPENYKNKPLVNASTIMKKVQDILKNEKIQALQKVKALTAKEKAINELRAELPDAIIETKMEWVKNGFYGVRNWKGSEELMACITYPNGIQQKYRVYDDGHISEQELIFPKIDSKKYRKILLGIKI